ncbi:DUF5763 domain-containing protein [Vibrio coralliilyticus]|uniref:Glycine zipper domain-containing protein n=1 Tax=Vibrio coralliilyticus TaxID=190893 RepID=A0AAP6ZPD3_9VIBR|nr:DUF5763 domain-containing protein [Vibrio coralliilyticus]NOJ25699.1 hypothetical protein [Vibrio coralliilyticus]
MKDGKRCTEPVYQDGYCEAHQKSRSFGAAGGAIIGAGTAGLFALGPVGVILGAVAGAVLGTKASEDN